MKKSSTKCRVMEYHENKKYLLLNFFNWFDDLIISKRSRIAKELKLESGDTLEATFKKNKK